jgi:hypothetical protein
MVVAVDITLDIDGSSLFHGLDESEPLAAYII